MISTLEQMYHQGLVEKEAAEERSGQQEPAAASGKEQSQDPGSRPKSESAAVAEEPASSEHSLND